MKNYLFVLSVLLLAQTILHADPYVVDSSGNPDPNFVVVNIMPQLDGQTPRLEAIRNSDYGTGVVAATVDSDILKVYRISNGLVSIIGTESSDSSIHKVFSVRFDWTNEYGGYLYLTVVYDSNNNGDPDKTKLIQLLPTGQFSTKTSAGSSSDQLLFVFDFNINNQGQANIYLEDADVADGTSFYKVDANFNLTKISQNLLPSDRTDLDIIGMKSDLSERYGNKMTMVDWDDNDYKCVIYQLYYGGTEWVWSQLNEAVHINNRKYRDLSFSPQGSFGQQLYVTERYSNTVQSVEPDGSDSVYAEGFIDIESITISDDGEHMYVSDQDGVWHIYNKNIVTIGPEFVMREPKADLDGVHTDPNGIDSVRLLFNDLIQFTNSDVEIRNEPNELIPLSVTGSGSQFMIIAFGQPLRNDKYTVTLKDSVVSAVTGSSIDGDNDGQAGGDYIFTMEHRERHDSDNDNDIDLYDLAELSKKWLWVK